MYRSPESAYCVRTVGAGHFCKVLAVQPFFNFERLVGYFRPLLKCQIASNGYSFKTPSGCRLTFRCFAEARGEVARYKVYHVPEALPIGLNFCWVLFKAIVHLLRVGEKKWRHSVFVCLQSITVGEESCNELFSLTLQ